MHLLHLRTRERLQTHRYGTMFRFHGTISIKSTRERSPICKRTMAPMRHIWPLGTNTQPRYNVLLYFYFTLPPSLLTLPPSLLLEGSLPAPVYTVNTNLFQGKQYGVAVYTQSVGKVQGIVRHIGYCGISFPNIREYLCVI